MAAIPTSLFLETRISTRSLRWTSRCSGRCAPGPRILSRPRHYGIQTLPGYGHFDSVPREFSHNFVSVTYLAALRHGFVPANEVGESGVKDKPGGFEIKLITKKAKSLGVGNTARIVTSDRTGLVQATSGIRSLTFDRWHDAR